MRIGIAGNKSKPHVREAIRLFMDFARERKVPLIFDRSLISFLGIEPETPSFSLRQLGYHCDMVIAFGGDGTLLATAIEVKDSGVPILGVNMGGLGFLAEVPMQEMEETIDDLSAGRYNIIERMMLKVCVQKNGKSKTYHALNDLVIDKGTTPRLVLVDVTVDRTYLNTYRCDGIIVATPTGSTAYSLSAGGPLLMPTMKAIIVTPICPHSLTVRPIVLSDESSLQVRIVQQEKPVQINIDGKNRFTLRPNEIIEISRAQHSIRWIATNKRDFFNLLRSKLKWGIELTALNRPTTTSGCEG